MSLVRRAGPRGEMHFKMLIFSASMAASSSEQVFDTLALNISMNTVATYRLIGEALYGVTDERRWWGDEHAVK